MPRITREQLILLYCKEKKTQAEIGEMFKIPQRTIGRWMKLFNIPVRFNNQEGGARHGRWSGGVIFKNGRYFVYCPWHPRASKKNRGKGGYVKRAILVWEAYYGPIQDGFIVHHKDEDKTNDDIKNLQLLTKSEHSQLHGKLYSQRWKDGTYR